MPLKPRTAETRGHGFGTAPVFLASISTILGALLFLRFGYAVGNLGVLNTLFLILLGHLVTIPTAMAIAEIATNRRVEGGGEYYIISRSFGTTIGGAIGISLYMSQAVSVAFYMIAFAEAFRPVFAMVEDRFGYILEPQAVSVPATLILVGLIVKKGASMGVRALYVVCVILGVSLIMFFLGKGTSGEFVTQIPLTSHVANPVPFIMVFAICFPAFTGMTAGVGLSGDLRNPGRSIPIGVLSATLVGMLVYVGVVLKLAGSATPEELASDPLVMSKIALWGPIIPIGLAAATISSAVGSLLVAPRTLQALARDRVLPTVRLAAFLARGRGSAHEPINATIVSGALALVFVIAGSVNFVAQIISIFFMVTYGALCSVSFLEHFAGNPSYRPTFRSRWYVSLLGALICLMTMFQMQPLYALLALGIMWVIYKVLRYTRHDERDLSAIFEGVMFQATRRMQIMLQQSNLAGRIRDWRPSFVAITRHGLDRLDIFDLLRWCSQRHGFSQMIHYIEGRLTPESHKAGQESEKKLIARTEESHAGVFVKSLIAPSYTTALAQVIQLPGVSGLPNNSVLFEFAKDRPEEMEEIVQGARLVAPLGLNVCVIRSSGYRFGYHKNIHIWLTADDLQNASLQILLSYILIGHPDWEDAEISLFACYPASMVKEELEKVTEMISEGHLPISPDRITPVKYDDESSFERETRERSAQADLTILGLTRQEIFENPEQALMAHSDLRDVLFVNANETIKIF
ncbi:MAG: amino acid permease [Acidobacteria bacterium]|nr:amino acid permease [Acidobacteriota bacterium]